MKPIKQLLEEYTHKRIEQYLVSDEIDYENDATSFLAGIKASNELVIQLWEALEWYSQHEAGFEYTRSGLHLRAVAVLNSIREKLEGTT